MTILTQGHKTEKNSGVSQKLHIAASSCWKCIYLYNTWLTCRNEDWIPAHWQPKLCTIPSLDSVFGVDKGYLQVGTIPLILSIHLDFSEVNFQRRINAEECMGYGYLSGCIRDTWAKCANFRNRSSSIIGLSIARVRRMSTIILYQYMSSIS